MAIEFDCPTCQTRIRTPDEAAGKKARCPKCQSITAIPFSAGPLPSASSFGSDLPGSSPFGPPLGKPASQQNSPQNPFGDQMASGGYSGPLATNPNPYASPAFAGLNRLEPLTPEEARRRLLIPAIGLCSGAVFCLAYLLMAGLAMAFDPGANFPDDGAEQVGYVVGMIIGFGAFCVPSLCMLLGAWSMFRGQSPTLAWTGAIAGLLPCNPCCIVSLVFGIWAIVVLSDARVTQAMSRG